MPDASFSLRPSKIVRLRQVMALVQMRANVLPQGAQPRIDPVSESFMV